MNARISVDWLTMSFVDLNSPDGDLDYLSIWDILGIPREKFSPNWAPMGYSVCLQYEGILVMWNTLDIDEERERSSNKNVHRMGLCVSISGSGCQFLNDLHSADGEFPFSSILANFFSLPSAKCTRIDIACDDIADTPAGGALQFRDFIDAHWYGTWVADARTSDLEMPKRSQRDNRTFLSAKNHSRLSDILYQQLDEGIYKAKCFYLGRRGCNFMLRVYDKLLERQEKGVQVDSSIKHWIRLEMELRKVIANTIAQNIMTCTTYDEVDSLCSSFLNGKVRFVNADNDLLHFCSVCSWWSKFVNTTNALFCSIISLTACAALFIK